MRPGGPSRSLRWHLQHSWRARSEQPACRARVFRSSTAPKHTFAALGPAKLVTARHTAARPGWPGTCRRVRTHARAPAKAAAAARRPRPRSRSRPSGVAGPPPGPAACCCWARTRTKTPPWRAARDPGATRRAAAWARSSRPCQRGSGQRPVGRAAPPPAAAGAALTPLPPRCRWQTKQAAAKAALARAALAPRPPQRRWQRRHRRPGVLRRAAEEAMLAPALAQESRRAPKRRLEVAGSARKPLPARRGAPAGPGSRSCPAPAHHKNVERCRSERRERRRLGSGRAARGAGWQG